jgi:ABC-type transport system involved in multi-copper enzyme maturation permease subunit
MPIHDLGYREWQGVRGSELLRWWVIAQNGFLRAWNNLWLRRLLFLVWIPAFYFGVVFFVYERVLVSTQGAGQNVDMMQLARGLAPDAFRRYVDKAAAMDAQQQRHYIWSLLLLSFFRYPQGTSMVLVVGLVAPPLIARDVRTKAFLLYFSRPISRLEYILGKSAAVWGYLVLITVAPALALYGLAVLLSPSIDVILYTWDLPLRIVAASVVLLLPTTALALAFSSLTRQVVTAGFLWYAVWVLGWMAHFILYSLDQVQSSVAGRPPEPVDDRWALISPYHTLGQVQSYVFDLAQDSAMVAWSTASLVLVTVLSLAVIFWRVSSPMRV